MGGAPAIQDEGMSFAYGGGEDVLSDVNATVPAGEFLAVVGPNGGGKTTLVRLILGLLQPNAGRALLFGRPPHHTRHRAGYVPQHLHFDPSFPVTVHDVVRMGRLGLGASRSEDRSAVSRALAEVGLARVERHSFADLSGGQRQRALIARALACHPELLVLDEPTAHVDPGAQSDLMELLHALNERLTVLVVTHDIAMVSHRFHRAMCVNRAVAVHPTAAITPELLQELFGGDHRLVRHDHHATAPGHA
jgi:zinc transport system ATP-binding protein